VQKYTHSYMHCWRHRTPIIYRATSQWFVGMDVEPREGDSLRRRALAGIEATEFFPAWGKARLHAMIANRPRLDSLSPAAVGHADGVFSSP
jgi:isoleucyl-tRNA synthetase